MLPNSANKDINKPNNFGKEGEDHINISVQSNFPLGRMFDPGYCANLDYPRLGKFKSVLTLVYWLKSSTKDDRIRGLRGKSLTKYIRDNKLTNVKLPNYKAIVLKATWLRIISNPDIVKAIKELPSDIAVLSYLTDRNLGVRITNLYGKHVTDIAIEVINAVKTNTVPNFDKYVDTKVEGALDVVDAVFKK